MVYTQRNASIVIKEACTLKHTYIQLNKSIPLDQRTDPNFKSVIKWLSASFAIP